MKRLKENIVILQTENSQLKEDIEKNKKLKEENESLKKRIVFLEEQIKIDKGWYCSLWACADALQKKSPFENKQLIITLKRIM